MDFFSYPDGRHAATLPGVLDQLDSAEWSRIVPYFETLTFERGDRLIEAETEDRALYILAEGEVEVLRLLSRGRTKRIATIREGSVFGEIAFFDLQPRCATIRALSDGSALRLDHRSLRRLGEAEPDIASALLFDLGRTLASRLRHCLACGES